MSLWTTHVLHCPYCGDEFYGNSSDRKLARSDAIAQYIQHVAEQHPGKPVFVHRGIDAKTTVLETK